TSLLATFVNGTFPSMFMPTMYENYVVEVSLAHSNRHPQETIELALWDTAGQEEYDPIRALSYPETHVVLLCFAVNSREGFGNVEDKWIREITHFLPEVPIILVGCKTDLKTDGARLEELRRDGQQPVCSDEGKAVAQKIGAKNYIECSAKNGLGVNEVFECATREALMCKTNSKSKLGRCCVVL
ncbi:P-loop containing nucleoside triphosphate hydrolase protein, partial [Coprinopsis sp. MPI-PUGE-AT-0042]